MAKTCEFEYDPFPMRTLVIVNPQSDGGGTARRWRRLEPQLRERLAPVDVEFTRVARDAERIAREGVRAGVERLVVAGGDGTLNEVASGLLGAELGDYVQIGLLPLGTGGDFLRTLGVPHDLEAALDCIVSAEPRPIDAGRLRFRDAGGVEREGWFVNVASAGIAALVEDLVNRVPRALGGRVAFALGAVRAVLGYRSQPVRVRVDDEVLYEGPVVLVAAANGRYFGAGMAVGAEARADDGLLDVVVVPGLSKRALLTRLPGLYRGAHLSDPDVQWRRGSRVEIEGESDGLRFEADGDPRGGLPVRIEVAPKALRFLARGS